jgi:hypothetical protein
VVGKAVLGPFGILVPLSALVQNDINHFVLISDILSGKGHGGVDDFAEELDIAVGVLLYPESELFCGVFVLVGGKE